MELALYVAWFRIKEPELVTDNHHENPTAPEVAFPEQCNAQATPLASAQRPVSIGSHRRLIACHAEMLHEGRLTYAIDAASRHL